MKEVTYKIRRNNKKKKYLIVVYLVIIITFIFLLNSNNAIKIANKNKEKNLIKDDFYEFINKKTIEDKQLKENESYWSEFLIKTQEDVDKKVSDIINDEIKVEDKNIENGINKSNKNNKSIKNNLSEINMKKLYDSIINLEKQDSMTILDKYIKLIDNSRNINEYIKNIIKINNDLSMGLILNYTIEDDYKDNNKKIINIYPTVYDFGNMYADYYTNPLYYPYVSNYISADRKILNIYGYSEEKAKQVVKDINKMYFKMAEKGKTMIDLKNISSNYNIVSKKELNEIYTNIDVINFIKRTGINENYNISIVDINQAKEINNLLINDNLEVLKEYAKLQILQEYGKYVNKKYYDVINNMQSKLLGIENKEKTLEDFSEEIIKNYYDDEITKIYFEKNVKEEQVIEFKNMINEILKIYKVRLQNNEWLTMDTKKKAINKLENIKVNIGEPKEWEDYSKKYKITDNLLENIINMNKEKVKYIINANKNNKKIQLMSQLMVNAYYNVKENSINFPVALFEYKYCKEGSYYQKLGSLGMIIAHEISHAFDLNGSKFDENGNLNNWWNEEDMIAFEKLSDKVIKYYDKYIINKKSVSGKRTVNENIADLGGLSCVVELAQKKNATIEEFKEIFEAYANLWVSKSTEEFQKMLMMTDEHSPDKVRTNAVLSSIDKFYEIYNITKDDGMYIEEKDRIKVW